MNKPARSRQRILQLHRWSGLSAGLLFVVVAGTGAALAFRTQLEPVLVPALLAGSPCMAPPSLDALVASARAASPAGGALTMARLYDDPRAAARVRLSDGEWIYVDPCSARVTGKQALYGGPFGQLARLHIFEYSGAPDLVAGSFALLFALATLGGGVVAWRPCALALARSSLAFRRGVHRGLSMYAAPLLLASAVSGMAMAFHWAQSGPHAASVDDGPSLPLAQLLARAQAVLPQARKIQIRFPAGATDPVVFEIIAADAPHANAFSYVHLDPTSGTVLRYVPYQANTASHKLHLLAAGFHYGWVGGLAGQLLLLAGALSVPVLAYTGIASYLRTRRRRSQAGRMTLFVTKKTAEAEGICSFELAAPGGKALPPYAAGAHLDVHVRPGMVRQYSLCGDPADRHRYLIAVQRAEDSRGGSVAMHDELPEGGELVVGAPRNHFPLVQSARSSLLFAGGIGVTPILAMAENLASTGADFHMHYCARSPERSAFRERIARSHYAQRVSFHFGEGPQGRRIDLPAVLAGPDPHTHLYVCGPAGFMDAVLAAARAQGWSEEQLHREYFAGTAQDKAGDKAFDVRIASSGQIVHVARSMSVIEALGKAGIEVPVSCLQGVCGTCVTRVLEGEPDHRDLVLTPAQKARNDRFTPCCSRARSAMLTLDL